MWNRYANFRELKHAQKYAYITAHTWVAAAKFNKDTLQYRIFRDSLLEAENSSVDEVNEYMNKYQKDPERYIHFANFLDIYVDSLVKLEDSILQATPPTDSALKVR